MAVPTTAQLLEWIKPGDISPDEINWAEQIGPGEYEVYAEKLNNICVEANELFIHSGVSSMLRAGDTVVGIYTAAGDMVTAALGTFLHAATAQLPIKYIIQNFTNNPTVGIREGDVFYANEALYGGIHNPDQIAIMPIFHEGKLISWSVAAVHQPETGACDPGGMCPSARSRYDEGMKLTPIKIGENYQLRDDLLEMMANFMRAPRMQMTDVRARFTGCDRVRLRLQQLAAEKGPEFLQGLFRLMIKHAEDGARQKIRRWLDGVYRCHIFSDYTSPGLGLTRMSLAIKKEGDRLIFDFAGTSPENAGSWHMLPHSVVAHVAVYLFSYSFHDLPVSSGSFVPFEFRIPERTLLNPTPSAAVSNSAMIGVMIYSICTTVFSKMMFPTEDRNLVAASMGGSCAAQVISGVNQWGARVTDILTYAINTFGQGGRPDMDGMHSHGFTPSPVGRAPDAEDQENEYPVLILTQRHARDSCGFGKFQGGTGCEFVAATHLQPFISVTSTSSGSMKVPAKQGLFGGYPHPVIPFIKVAGADLLEMMARNDKALPASAHDLVTRRPVKGKYEFASHKLPSYVQARGNFFITGSTGGCGYGDPLERDPDMVVRDIRDGIISPRTAERIYKVAYDSETWLVDEQKTRQQRQEARQARLKRARPYDEFEKEWLKKKPNEEILRWYGSWPEANELAPVIRI